MERVRGSEAATAAAATGAAEGSALAGAGVIAGLTLPAILVAELHKRFGWFGLTSAEPKTHGGRQGTGTEGGPARGDPNPLFKSARQMAEEHQKAARAAHDSSQNMLLRKKATDDTRKALEGHVGAWPNITGPLRGGDVALGYGAQAQYLVQPGEYFMTASGHWVRFADRSGSKDPYNIDYFKGAMGGIVRRPTFGLIGEAGPEKVLPLSRAGQLGAVNVSISRTNHFGAASDSDLAATLHEHAEQIAYQVRRVIEDEHRRSAVV